VEANVVSSAHFLPETIVQRATDAAEAHACNVIT